MTEPYTTAKNGDPVARNYDQALELLSARRLSLGVCGKRCSSLRNRKPLAFAWRGTAPASSRSCPVCGGSLKRMTRYRWVGCVQLLNMRLERRERRDRRTSPRHEARNQVA